MEQHGNHFDPVTRIFRNVTVPVAVLTTILVLDQIPIVTGSMVQCSCWTSAVDTTVTDAVSTTIQEGSFRIVGANLASVTQNRVDKQAVGGANNFAADVLFVVVPGLPAGGFAPLVLVASNAVAPRTGNILVRYWINQFRGG